MHHGAQTSASKMPSSGPYFPREEGKTSTVKSPCFLHFGDRPRTGKATSLSSVPWGCPLWGQWALWGSRLLVPSLLKKPVPWVPPPGQQAPYRPSRGAAATEQMGADAAARVPVHSWESAAREGICIRRTIWYQSCPLK